MKGLFLVWVSTICGVIILDFFLQNFIFITSRFNIFINKVNYLPVIIILYFIINDIFKYWQRDFLSIKYHITESGIVYFEDYSLWISIFESDLKSAFIEDFKQLKNLEEFSFEYNPRNSSLHFFLFANSFQELLDRKKTAKAILDTIFPNSKPVPEEKIKERFNNVFIAKLGKYFILQEKGCYILTHYKTKKFKSISTNSKLVFASKYFESEGKRITQLYEKKEFEIIHKFSFLKEIIELSKTNRPNWIWKANEIKNARFNYLLSRIETISFEEGINQIIAKLNKYYPVRSMDIGEGYAPSGRTIFKLSDLNDSRMEKNTICTELCFLNQNRELGLEQRSEKCYRRREYCLRLAKNVNITKVIKKIFEEEGRQEKNAIMSELVKHLSFQHLICLLAQFSQINSSIEDRSSIISILLLILNQNNLSSEIETPLEGSKVEIMQSI